MSDLNKIKAKIAAMSQKTVENGCSEDEALGAAKIMSDMLDKYGMTLEDIEAYKNTAGEPLVHFDAMLIPKAGLGAMQYCLRPVMALFSCKTIIVPTDEGKVITLFGLEEDRLCVHAMLATIRVAMDQATEAFLLADSSGIHGNKLRASFRKGFAIKVSNRLFEIVEEKARRAQALILRKDELIEKKLNEMGMGSDNSKPVKLPAVVDNDDPRAVLAGYVAGDLADIGIERKIA